MPITDYKNTIMYKIVCNDLSVTDCYVGHTINMTKRKCKHKHACNNMDDKAHNLKIYQIIRENGGWSNWSMILVEEFPCKDKNEACKREREVYEELDSKMNTRRPYRTQEEHKQQFKQYYQDHKEKIEQYHKQYYEDHQEEIKQHGKKYREDHKEEIAEKSKQYREDHKEHYKQHYQDHKEKIEQYKKQYYQDHKEEIAEHYKQYYQDHKEKLKQYQKEKSKQYREDHKEEINKKIQCEFCKKLLSKCSMYRHHTICKCKE